MSQGRNRQASRPFKRLTAAPPFGIETTAWDVAHRGDRAGSVVVGVALQRDQVAALDRVATREHRTRSAMLRLALAQWFAGLAPERATGLGC